MTDFSDALDHLGRQCRRMHRLIQKVGPCRLKTRNHRSPFRALVQAITYQQLNGTAAAAIFGRLKALYPGRVFPSPEDLLDTPDERLRSVGLSRAKVAAVKDLAAHTISGVVPSSRAIRNLSDEEILERISVVRGIGPWTIEMLLIFTLGRQDVWPVTDFGVRKGFARLYGLKELPTPKALLAHGQKWRPHRSVAAWYLWRAAELPES